MLVFEALTGSLVAAILHPGKRATGEENAMIMKRVLTLVRQHFHDTHILVASDGYFSNPKLMALIDAMPNTGFTFGLAGNSRLQRLAEPIKQRACAL